MFAWKWCFISRSVEFKPTSSGDLFLYLLINLVGWIGKDNPIRKKKYFSFVGRSVPRKLENRRVFNEILTRLVWVQKFSQCWDRVMRVVTRLEWVQNSHKVGMGTKIFTRCWSKKLVLFHLQSIRVGDIKKIFHIKVVYLYEIQRCTKRIWLSLIFMEGSESGSLGKNWDFRKTCEFFFFFPKSRNFFVFLG